MQTLTRARILYQRCRQFVLHDIWLLDPNALAYGLGFLIRQLRVMVIVARGFVEDQCLLRAAALTYTTMLALVPMLAFMFAFLKGLGVQNLLETVLVDKIPVGSAETVRLIINFVNNIKVGTLGAIGLGSLLLTTLLQLGTVEHSLNEIWGVQEGRSLFRKLTDYISVMVVAPVALLVAVTATAALKNQTLVTTLMGYRFFGDAMVLVFTSLPYVAVWIALTFVYVYMPNIQVKIVPALIGGVVAGTLWQFAQWAYIEFQIGMARYNAIYGVFAQLPLLMFWLYISWVIVLLGAELSFACQNTATYPLERITPFTSFHVREWLALTFYFALTQAFMQGNGPWSALTFAHQNRVPVRLTREIMRLMVDERLVVEVADAPEHYVPGLAPSSVTPWHVLHALRHHGDAAVEELMQLSDARASKLLMRLQKTGQQVAGARSVQEWLTDTGVANEPS